ncbi:HD-GYP domain-containing protein [Halobacillus litoralis]|uniref:Phosphohydrolase n=1 Tax=Halobacillus litoralis TaxID=45668 RepID=A0A410MJB4_9BACI|nr:HD domain-containing phosphohydrolase [Halobacillus litoralis]QAS54817.1 phosphohydrolase [Halobacillus litoralis]
MSQTIMEQPNPTHTIDALLEHDFYTLQHSLRVAELLYNFGCYLGFRREHLKELYYLGIEHDLGKLDVPKKTLNKKGKLTSDELGPILEHPIKGYQMVKKKDLYPPNLLEGILYHHENLDGSGYPYGLKANKIPLYARILRIVDSYDAMTTNRSYSKALTIDKSLTELQVFGGSYYDEELVKKFVSMVGSLPKNKSKIN